MVHDGCGDQALDCHVGTKQFGCNDDERACSGSEQVDSVEAAVSQYIKNYRRRAARELEYFRLLRSDEEAVSRAALAQLPSGKRHPHQRRIPRDSLEQSRGQLLNNLSSLRNATSFDELFEQVEMLTRPI
ncbi:MAG: hypothetical protein ACRERD_34620, partial [Candidatus Binatia bacterium]